MKLVKNDSYLLLIGEEAEIKEGNYYCFPTITGFFMKQYFEKQHFKQEPCISLSNLKAKKIIAYYPLTKEAKELDLPLLPNPFEEVNIEKLAINEEKLWQTTSKWDFVNGYVEGYKTAQPKQFSLEDMYRVAIKVANKVSRPEYGEIININEIVDTYIQSLRTQQLPKEFIPEYDLMNEGYNKPEDYPYQECKVLKTITNSEGKEEIQGKYVC